MKVMAIIQARMLSSRLRGKSLIAVAGKPLLGRVIDRVKSMDFIDEIVVATTIDAADEPIVSMAEARGIRCARGSRDDVLGRFVEASKELDDNDCILRFTADNPLYDPERSKKAFERHGQGFDYTYIDGLSHMVPEFIRAGALRKSNEQASEKFDREHVTPFLRKNKNMFKCEMVSPDFADLRPELDCLLTIDNQNDLDRIEGMIRELEEKYGEFRLDDCYRWLDRERIGLPGIAPIKNGEKRVKIAGRWVGDGCPSFIVAEIGQNHNGQMGMAKRLIEMAARCRADAVKFQIRNIDWELTEEAYNRPYDHPNSFGVTYGEHRQFLELSEEQHIELKEYAQALGLVYFCTACDEPSVEVMERVGNPVYKIASRDITNIPLLKVIAETKKPIIISTGMASMSEIEDALDVIGKDPFRVMITHCLSQYPTEIKNVNLRAVHSLRNKFGLLTGLSDHTTGIITGVAGAVMGASYIEKHITLSRAMQGTDHAAALEEEGLRRLVDYIRLCEVAMGDGEKVLNPSIEAARQKLSRSLTSKVAIPSGTVVTENMLILKSPGTGLLWRDRGCIVGKKALHDIRPNVTLFQGDFV